MSFHNSVDILTHTPAKLETYVNIEDTFWSEKRKLIPDYSVMETIDQHVLKANSALKSDPGKLVEYLIKPCTNEVQKARALIRWMGENIQYDINYLKTGKRGANTVADVLRTGQAICDGYGQAFNLLGSLAGVECRQINGQAKGSNYYPGCFDPARLSKGPSKHVWNAIKINGQWYLSDPTWAAGSIRSEDGKLNFKKEWKEMWFLSEPNYFALSHIPLDGDRVIIEDQYMDNPFNNPVVWANQAMISPQAGVYGIKLVSHKKAMIKSSTGEVTIQFTCKFPLSLYIKVVRRETKGKSVVINMGQDIQNMVGIVTLGNKCSVVTRFQEVGTYEIWIWGGIINGHPALQVDKTILAYQINAVQKCKTRPFPVGIDNKWGVQQSFIDTGYSLECPNDYSINTTNGLAVVRIKLPSDGIFPNLFKLVYADKKGTTQNLDNYVIASREANIATYHVQCPSVGEYKFQVCAKYDASAVGLKVGAAFLITCKAPIPNPIEVDTNCQFLGINQHFVQVGLTTSVKNSIITIENGKATVELKRSNPVNLLFKLKSGGNDIKGVIAKQEDGDITMVTITPPAPGFYVFTIFASITNEPKKPCAGRFGIDYDTNMF